MPNPWGKSVAIDLYDCSHDLVSNPEPIKAFIKDVIPMIGMQAHGPTLIERFGEGEIEGWSAMQFIETSSITIHADELHNRCFIDIFSCKDFDESIAVNFALTSFQAKSHKVNSLTR